MKHVTLLFILALLAPVTALAQAIVTGRLVGANGRPMSLAHVHLKASPIEHESLASIECDHRGYFRIPIASPGIYTLEATGVDHQIHYVPLIAITRDTIEIDIRLAANNAPLHPDEVMIIGAFNKWSFREPK